MYDLVTREVRTRSKYYHMRATIPTDVLDHMHLKIRITQRHEVHLQTKLCNQRDAISELGARHTASSERNTTDINSEPPLVLTPMEVQTRYIIRHIGEGRDVDNF